MKEMKRVLSLVLCLVMLLGMIPGTAVTALAAEGDPTIVIAGSDYQNTNGGLFSSATATDAYAIMSQIKEDYPSAYGFLFGGDYYAHNTNTTTESTNGKNQLKNEIVDVLYPDMADDTQIYIQGNHDADALTTNGTLATSGAHDTAYYGVYVINEKDYMWYNDNQSTIQNTASALESYLDAKLNEGYSKPIFVLSHLPLHYSNRTIKEGDGKYAKYIYDVLDEAGANDLNIIFMYGHNHSTSYYEEYLGNAAVYLAEGDTIYVADEGSKSTCFSDTLNFTYMNYGFTGYLTGTAADGALTMTVFEIYTDEVKVKRYDKSGVHNLKSAGTNGSTPAGATVNTTAYESPQTIKLTTPEEKATFTDNGVTVTAGGITGVTASKAESPTYNSSLYSGYEEYTVSAEGYEAGKTATVTIALTNGDFDTTRSITVKFPDAHTETVSVVNGTITLTTTQLGTFTLMQKVQTEIEIPGDSSDTETSDGTIWRQVTSFTAGKKYMLVNYGDNASGVGTFAVNSTAGGTSVTVQTDATGAYIENENMALAWTYNTNAELTNADTNQYLYIENYPSGTSGVKVNVTNNVTTGTSYSSWKLATNTGVNEVSLSAYRNGSSNYYPARWSNGGSEYLAYTSTQTDKHDNWIAIFEQTSEGGSSSGGSSVDTSGNNWVTITEPTGGTTTYTYTQVDSITAGEKYVIVGNNHAVALQGTTSMGTQSVTISGTTMTSTTALTEWTFSGSSNGTIYNGTRYLRYNNSAFSLSTSSTNFTITDNGSNFRIQSGNYSFYYNGSSWTRSGRNTAQYVRLYQLTDTTTTGGSNGLYGKLDGELSYTVPYGTSEAVALQKVKDGIAIKYATAADYSDEATFADDGEGMTWEVVDYDGNTAGEYAVKISYNDTLLGTAKIIVSAKPAGTAQVTIDSDSGTVRQNAGVAALTGSKLTITYQDGTTKTVDVTVGMVKNADGTAVDTSVAGTYTGLKVVYTFNGVEYTICNNYTLTVRENVQNNYPEYPDEGAVAVNKTATGIDFQSTGIAQVELSTSGVPSKKGVDVIVMVDTSSSMKRGENTGNDNAAEGEQRIDFLQTAVANLIKQFQAPGDDGEQLDIKVAIAEFNGYTHISNSQTLDGTSVQTASNVAEIFTGTGEIGVGAFVDATTITNPDTFAAKIGAHSGTNYDYAFDTIYRLGSAIQAENDKNNEERDLFVIFMSDGAPYQYNYYGSQTVEEWNAYLLGTIDTSLLGGNYTSFYNEDGDHWMAEAIKGEPDSQYLVIDPTKKLGEDANVSGDDDYFRMVPGLGAEVHTIGFCLYDDDVGEDGVDVVYEETQQTVMQNLASVDGNGDPLYHETKSGEDLNDIFCEIASQIAYAANNARFVDQMGDDFDLQIKTATYTTVENGVEKEKTLAPVIEVGTYPIYTRQDYLEGKCTENQIGNRIGSFKLTEVVMFSEDGSKAYSNLIDVDGDGTFGVTVNSDGTYTISDTGDNILGADGVILARSFMYNTGATAVTVEIKETKKSITLESEQFYWFIGTVQTSEVALRYYVYLEGSMEGTREAGSYPTNESAILYYDNYLGNACEKPTTSPVMAWKEANVSYAFYLVNENGEIIVNQTTGQTGTFANKVAITNPVVYQNILLNSEETVTLKIIAEKDDVLPKYYTLYDEGAVYTINVNSNSTGGWTINKGNVAADSTYVTQYKTDNASAYSNALTMTETGNDYTHTVVWFAVVWSVQAHPDTVVIDYGLPVDISVLTNDMFGENGKLAGVGAYSDGIENIKGGATLQSGFEPVEETVEGVTVKKYEHKGTYGTAVADLATGKVRYTPGSMEMNGYEKFAYAVNYTGATNPGYYYDTVTVIPATTIYYEDSFVTLESYTYNGGWQNVDQNNEKWVWSQEGKTADGTQDEDRPGQYSLTDANNIYGYDSVNKAMSQYSMGSALKASVNDDNYGTASFQFYGTGFDVFSMTDSTTGTIFVKVYPVDADGNVDGTAVRNHTVDTYYGYRSALCNVTYTYTVTSVDADKNPVSYKWVRSVGEEVTDVTAESKAEFPESPQQGDTVTGVEYALIVDPDAEDSMYQVPVIKIEGLTYGRYKAVITAQYSKFYDHAENGSYHFYLDAIRIYDPANDGAADGSVDTTIENAYVTDSEGWPSYQELRNVLISAETLGNADTATVITGLVFIDGDAEVGDAQISDYISYGPNNEVYLAPGQRVAFMLNVPANIAKVHIGIKSADGNVGTYTITNVAKETNKDTGVTAGKYYNPQTFTINTATDMYYDLTGWRNDIIVISNTGNTYNTTGIISLTNIKFTYTSDPNGTATADLDDQGEETTEPAASNEGTVYMTRSAAMLTLRSLNAAAEETPEETVPETTEPEETIPETTEPEETVPETTEPEETVPETTEPEETVPETTEPEETIPETTEPEETVPETTEPEETVPEITEPEETIPETTEPEETVPEVTEPNQDPVESIRNFVKKITTQIGNWLSKWFN